MTSKVALLLSECEARDIRLTPDCGGKLHVNAPRGVVTPDLLARIKAHKSDLLSLLNVRDVLRRQAGLPAEVEAAVLDDSELARRVAALSEEGQRFWAERVAARLRDGERPAGLGWRALVDVRRMDPGWGAHTASAPAAPSGADDSDGWPEGCIEPMPCPTCGEWLSWQDMAGRWRCPRCDAAALERAVRWMENAARLRAVAPAVEPWPTEAAEFCLRLAPDDLPPTPFRLTERTTVHDKERFLQYIKQCIRLRIASEGEREDIIALRQVALEWAGYDQCANPRGGV